MDPGNNRNSKLIEWLSSTRLGRTRPAMRFRRAVYGLTRAERNAIQNHERKMKEANKIVNANMRRLAQIEREAARVRNIRHRASQAQPGPRVNFKTPKGYVRTPFGGNVRFNPNASVAGFFVPRTHHSPKKFNIKKGNGSGLANFRRAANEARRERQNLENRIRREKEAENRRRREIEERNSRLRKAENAIKELSKTLSKRQLVHKLAKNYLGVNIPNSNTEKQVYLKIHPNKGNPNNRELRSLIMSVLTEPNSNRYKK